MKRLRYYVRGAGPEIQQGFQDVWRDSLGQRLTKLSEEDWPSLFEEVPVEMVADRRAWEAASFGLILKLVQEEARDAGKLRKAANIEGPLAQFRDTCLALAQISPLTDPEELRPIFDGQSPSHAI